MEKSLEPTPLGKKLPLPSCTVAGSPARHLVVGLEALSEGKLEPTRYQVPLHLFITMVNNEDTHG